MDKLLGLTIFIIFFATLAGIILRRMLKDKCLRLLDDHHVTFIKPGGRVLWGDLKVSSQGLELCYDAPFVTSRGLVKSSFLVLSNEMSEWVALCRTVRGLTDIECRAREEQVQRTFRPSLAARGLRVMRNLVDLVQDAIVKSLSALVGALGSQGRMGKAVQSRAGDVGELGTTLVSAMANAFEPLLERHIGKPVIITFNNPQGASEPVCEFPGYLVDYTEEYVAVFNVDQAPEETFEVKTAESTSRDNMLISISGARAKIDCTGPDALVLHSVSHSGSDVELGVVLIPGCCMEFDLTDGEPITVSAERTRKLDWVCSRARGRVQFGSDAMATSGRRWDGAGVSPEAGRTQSDSLPNDQ